jgi:hypothetical protein
MLRVMSPAHDGMRPAAAGAEIMRTKAESGDMAPTLRPMLRCSQQVHLQLFRDAGSGCNRGRLSRWSVFAVRWGHA